ncbi:NAD-dependent epimerase/dehydratase family protein [Phycobacter azelaicus]|uniref:NAD-dependent epimerase/dehydratase family protein n=1 Tax=Phycobacter azelaicus TaxID=2668075 RepID=UPI0018678481|nr:NAD-dependent epimerase/dehydratase family protein [Phycobacter azelaicus]
MRVLILGATGSIGTAITRELVRNGHTAIGLARSFASEEKIRALGAEPLAGDLRHPREWSAALAKMDAVIHAAATFEADMAETDRKVVMEILSHAAGRTSPLRFLYTGGCWLYGVTGAKTADETSTKRPLQSFKWMLEQGASVLQAPGVSAAVVHPALVYHEEGGAFARYLAAAKAGEPIEVWGSLRTRWPLVHRDDLARAYLTLLERPELIGEFNVCGQTGVPVSEIIAEVARRSDHTSGYVVRTLKYVLCKYGAWAEGPTMDQQISAEKIQSLSDWQPKHTCFRSSAF